MRLGDRHFCPSRHGSAATRCLTGKIIPLFTCNTQNTIGRNDERTLEHGHCTSYRHTRHVAPCECDPVDCLPNFTRIVNVARSRSPFVKSRHESGCKTSTSTTSTEMATQRRLPRSTTPGHLSLYRLQATRDRTALPAYSTVHVSPAGPTEMGSSRIRNHRLVCRYPRGRIPQSPVFSLPRCVTRANHHCFFWRHGGTHLWCYRITPVSTAECHWWSDYLGHSRGRYHSAFCSRSYIHLFPQCDPILRPTILQWRAIHVSCAVRHVSHGNFASTRRSYCTYSCDVEIFR